jgi:hypothetical protein
MYATSALVARAEHGVELTAADRATISSRFAIAAPAWGTTAEVTVFRGAPGRDPPPRELVRGTIALDGSTAVLAVPPRDVAAQLRWIYAGAVHPADEPAPRDPSWGHGSQAAVWVWLELADHAIGPGPLHVHLEPAGEPARDIDVPARARREAAPGLRLPLWIDDGLHGKRERRTAQRGETGRALVDQFQIAIASTRADGAPREVWIEEQLRPAPHRTVSHGWPIEPIVTPRTLRLPLEVAPGQLARAGFDVAYDW